MRDVEDGSPLLSHNFSGDSQSNGRRIHVEESRLTLVGTIRLSKIYLLYCICLAVATLALMLYMMLKEAGKPVPTAALAAETTVIICMALEVLLFMLLLGKKFWNDAWNGFDLFVALLSMTCLLLMWLHERSVIGVNEAVGATILAFRYISQVARIVRFTRTSIAVSQQQAAVENRDISLPLRMEPVVF